MNKKEKAEAINQTDTDIDARLSEMCRLHNTLNKLETDMNVELLNIRTKCAEQLSELRDKFNAHYENVRVWAEARKARDFSKVKSMQLANGIIGFRKGQPYLKPIKGITWEKITNLMRKLYPAFLRVKEEVDREALLSAKDEIGMDGLKDLGLIVHQEERFFAELKTESIPIHPGKT